MSDRDKNEKRLLEFAKKYPEALTELQDIMADKNVCLQDVFDVKCTQGFYDNYGYHGSGPGQFLCDGECDVYIDCLKKREKEGMK